MLSEEGSFNTINGQNTAEEVSSNTINGQNTV